MKEEKIDISKLDLTKQTISLGPESGPVVSLMKGHVDELTWVKAFRAEGWDSELSELTEEELKHDAECEKGMLEHTHGIFNKKENTWKWNVCMHDDYAEPVTIRHW